MTDRHEDLIERIRETNDRALKRLVECFGETDLCKRFRLVDALNEPSLDWAIPLAKAAVIETMKRIGDEETGGGLSYSAIGELLGLSAQRVHQLANPERPRRSNVRRNNAG